MQSKEEIKQQMFDHNYVQAAAVPADIYKFGF